MKTQAEQYRTLVARLEAIQEAPIPSPGMVQSATNAVTSPDASGSVLRALLTTGMSVVPEIVAFLMKNKSQLSPKCQGVLNQTWSGPATQSPDSTGSMPSTKPTWSGPATGGPANPTWSGPATGGPAKPPAAGMYDPTQTRSGTRGM
jgi:hypothetical protein